jgi:hypothetical protein
VSVYVTKREVVEMATIQCQRAQQLMHKLGAHAWRTTVRGDIVTKDERNEHLRLAVRYAQALTRDAETMLSWLEQYARQEGAID